MNTSIKIIILSCMVKNDFYFESIDDFKNVSKDIFKYLKFTPEYSIETIIFKYFYLTWIECKKYSSIKWKNFLLEMKSVPTGEFRSKEDDMSCDTTFLLETHHFENVQILKKAYELLFIKNMERIYIYEAIIITKFLQKVILKYKFKKIISTIS